MADISELDKKLTLTWGLFKGIITSVVITVFSVTTIYWRFQASERELQVLQDKVEYERERSDRKINPIKNDLESLEIKLMFEKIKTLEEENEILRKMSK